jgi:hypothetical protein
MVHKNNKWNISKEKGEEIAHKYIIEILQDSKHNMISLSELSILLNQRTKHIKFIQYSKKKPMSVYMRCSYGNIINFLDNFTIYGVINNDSDIQIKLLDTEITNKKFIEQNIMNEHKDWILIDDEDFIMI